MKFKNRTALITGAGRGIGRAIALAFAEEGADLILTARTESELKEVRAACAAKGVKARNVVADLAQRQAVDEIFQAVDGTHVDILVNNAAIGSGADPRPLIDYDDAFWDRTLQINLTAPYRLSKGVLPGMIKAGHGRIINISSIMGKTGFIHGAAYCASKHGLNGLTKSLALEVVKDGITVNAICPGGVKTRTGMSRASYEMKRQNKTLEQLEAGSTPLGRILRPEEISPLAVFLASDEALGITGACYNVDAGTVLW
jgi:NAD(P)-dependent dehydrogenase (short-subunit alcohol dehydrogenase family)